VVKKVNRAGFVSDEDLALIERLGAEGLLTADETARLSVRRGNLTPDEWVDMRSHIDRSVRILSEIPWPDELVRVPEIAHRHHEKLDGSGYPLGLSGEQIDLDARIIEIADIYDALTAQDRPYKPAMPHEKARKILEGDAAAGKLDAQLVGLFFERNLHEADLNGDTQVLAQAG
jgi:3',5'-cyclic-nucleotide phosphodiesterase